MSELEVKIKKGNQETTVLEKYLPSFLKDGWKEVDEDAEEANAERQAEINKENEDKQRELERLAAKGRVAEEEENRKALARIELEKQEAEDRRTQDVRDQQADALGDTKKRHETHIIGNEDKDVIADYVKYHFNRILDKRGSLESVQDKALAIVDEFYAEQIKSLKE